MEYKILEATTLISEDQLNRIALEGWKLVTIVPCDDKFYFYFGREK